MTEPPSLPTPAPGQNHSEQEAAAMIGISPISLWRARKRGEIAYYRINGRVLYADHHINDFLTKKEVHPNAT